MKHRKLKPSQSRVHQSPTPQWVLSWSFCFHNQLWESKTWVYSRVPNQVTHTKCWIPGHELSGSTQDSSNVHSSPCGRLLKRMNEGLTTSLWMLALHGLALQVTHNKKYLWLLHTHNLIIHGLKIQHTWCYTGRINCRQNFKHNSFQLRVGKGELSLCGDWSTVYLFTTFTFSGQELPCHTELPPAGLATH